MKKSSRIVGTLSLFVAACGMFMALGSRPASVATQSQEPKDKRKEKLQRLKIEDFQGEAASLRAKQLRKLHKGVARAMKDAEKHGLRPAFDKGRVILATDPDRPTNPGSFVGSQLRLPGSDLIRPASFKSPLVQDITQDGYEITFIPYDDGDPNTWEGIIYRNGPDIDEDTRYAVINIQTEEPQTLVDSYYPPDGGDPQPVLFMSKQSKPGKEITIACNGPQELRTVRTSLSKKVDMWTNPRAQGCPAGQHRCIGKEAMGCCGPIPGLDNWIKCSLRYSGYSAITCIAAGPAWALCWSWGHIGGMFFCVL